MKAHECSRVPMSAHKYPWVIIVPCSWVFMAAHEHSLGLINTYKKQWALMSMASWHNQHSWVLNEHSYAWLDDPISKHSALAPYSSLRMEAHRCTLVLRIVQCHSWVPIYALLSDPEGSMGIFGICTKRKLWKMSKMELLKGEQKKPTKVFRSLESRENQKTKVETVLVDTL